MFSAIVSLASIACICGIAVCVLALLQAGAFRDGTVFFILIAGASACGLAYLLGGDTFSRRDQGDENGRRRASPAEAIFSVLGVVPIWLMSLADQAPWLHRVMVLVAYAVMFGFVLAFVSGRLLIRAMRTAPPRQPIQAQ